MGERLPVHGFVLAGGKSTRMGVDKALVPFCGRPMVEIAVEKLRQFCAEVWISGNREDLAEYATVVPEVRLEIGPAAGVEAGLSAALQPWVMFVPVDVPLVPTELLRRWVGVVVERDADCGGSYLVVNQGRQPAFCVARRDCLAGVSAAIERGERRLAKILEEAVENGTGRGLWKCDAAEFAQAEAATTETTAEEMAQAFCNVNTPEELAEAEQWVEEVGSDAVGAHPRKSHHE